MQLRDADVARIHEQGWTARLGVNPIISFRGQAYLRQNSDGACVFLMHDGRCQVHAEFGFEKKPISCQMFPYMIAPRHASAQMGVSFACQSVVENKGQLVREQVSDATRIALRGVPEVLAPVSGLVLSRGRSAEAGEVERLATRLIDWIGRELPLTFRLDGIAWIAQTLAAARLDRVRGVRFNELIDVLFDALAQELPLQPFAPATARQCAMLRSALFARTEDPKPLATGAPGRLVAVVSQLSRSRVWRRGSGAHRVPLSVGDADAPVTFAAVSRVTPAAQSHECAQVDELMTRWLRSSIEGGRVWGSGYYGWSVVEGMAAVSLAAAAIGWLSRWEAARVQNPSVRLEHVQSAVRRIDRTAGRAPWLGGRSERLRLAYLVRDDGLRRVISSQFA